MGTQLKVKNALQVAVTAVVTAIATSAFMLLPINAAVAEEPEIIPASETTHDGFVSGKVYDLGTVTALEAKREYTKWEKSGKEETESYKVHVLFSGGDGACVAVLNVDPSDGAAFEALEKYFPQRDKNGEEWIFAAIGIATRLDDEDQAKVDEIAKDVSDTFGLDCEPLYIEFACVTKENLASPFSEAGPGVPAIIVTGVIVIGIVLVLLIVIGLLASNRKRGKGQTDAAGVQPPAEMSETAVPVAELGNADLASTAGDAIVTNSVGRSPGQQTAVAPSASPSAPSVEASSVNPDVTCPYCGTAVAADVDVCPACNATLDNHDSDGSASSTSGQATEASGFVPYAAGDDEDTVILVDPSAPKSPVLELERRNGAHVRIVSFPATIGKGSDADVCIAGNSTISRVHARLLEDGGIFAVVDLTSTNKTFINGYELMPGEPTIVSDGDTLRLGSEELKVHVVR